MSRREESGAWRAVCFDGPLYKKRTTPVRCSSFENPAVKIIFQKRFNISMYENQLVPDLLYGYSFKKKMQRRSKANKALRPGGIDKLKKKAKCFFGE
jgi:hypothetical protein